MKLIREEAGQTVVFTAFLMTCLLGFMALAIDVGVLIRAQRKVQTAADAAAIAGTLEYFYHGSANAAAVAKAAAGNNGISDPSQVTVNIPPSGGWHTGASYLEVIISQPNPTIFVGAFGAMFNNSTSFRTMNVGARAVGGIVPGADCGHITDPSNAKSFTLQGGATVVAPHCRIQVSSISPEAMCITGNNALGGLDTAGIDLAVPQQKGGNCNKLYSGAQVTGTSSGGDPLSGLLTLPTAANLNTDYCNNTNTVPATITSINSSTNLSTYVSPVSKGGFASTNPASYNVTCFAAANVALSGVTLGDSSANNLFIFENGVQFVGNDTINGTTLLWGGNFCQGNITGGNCKFNNNATLNMTAPANSSTNTYAWNGLALVVPSSNTTPNCDNSYKGPSYAAGSLPNSCIQMQFGSGSGNLTGLIYAPSASLYMQDNGGGTVVTGFIVDSLDVNSSLSITDSYNAENPDSPLAVVSLVE